MRGWKGVAAATFRLMVEARMNVVNSVPTEPCIILRRRPHFGRHLERSSRVPITTLGGWKQSMSQKKLVYGKSTSGTMHVDATKETRLGFTRHEPVLVLETRMDVPPFRWQEKRPKIAHDPRHTRSEKKSNAGKWESDKGGYRSATSSRVTIHNNTWLRGNDGENP